MMNDNKFIIPEPTYSYSTKLYGFDQILNFYKTNRFDTQLDCQRGLVWTDQQKQDMIDTIVRRERIPEFHVIKEDSEAIFHFADGKQRITTSIDFLTNNLKWSKLHASKDFLPYFGNRNFLTFNDLHGEWQNAILSSELQFACYRNMTPRSTTVLFRKLNSGTKLSTFARFLSQNIILKKYFLDPLLLHPVCIKLFSSTAIEKDDAEMTLIRAYLLIKAWDKNHFHTNLDLTPSGLEKYAINIESSTDTEINDWIEELTKYKDIIKEYLNWFNSIENSVDKPIRSNPSFQVFLAIYYSYIYNFDINNFEKLYRFLLTQKAANIVNSGADYGPTNLKKYFNYCDNWIETNIKY